MVHFEQTVTRVGLELDAVRNTTGVGGIIYIGGRVTGIGWELDIFSIAGTAVRA